jgi:hypothetical protein
VLFDLLTIRMVSGFAERPLMWFALLAMPFFLLSSVIVVWQITYLLLGVEGSLPIAGAGVFFGVLCIFLLFSGGLAELINMTGNLDVMKVRLLTMTEVTPKRNVKLPEDDDLELRK